MSLINKKNFFFWLILRSIFSVFYINILIVLSRTKNKKIFFYYPRKLTTRIHTFYIEDLFKIFLSNTTVIYGHEVHHIKLGKNYISTKP